MDDKNQSKGRMSTPRVGWPAASQASERLSGEQAPAEQGYRIAREGTYIAEGDHGAFRAEAPALTGRIEARLTWDEKNSPPGLFFHLSAFLVDVDDRVPAGNLYYCVNHDNNRSKDGSTERRGYKPHGTGGSRDETLTINLQWVDEEVEKIVFVGYLQTGSVEHTFVDIQDGLVTLSDLDNLAVFDEHRLDNDYGGGQRAVIIGELERQHGDEEADVSSWVYVNVGQGRTNLKEVGAMYGVLFV